MLSTDQPVVARAVDLASLLAKKSYFLLGPRQTGKTFLIRHTLPEARYYDLLDSAVYLAFSRFWKRGIEGDFASTPPPNPS